jgi:hypothetical protein
MIEERRNQRKKKEEKKKKIQFFAMVCSFSDHITKKKTPSAC